jgi:hypothetical protein
VRIGDVASAIGKGLFAGAVGTAAMTVSSTIEQRVRGRDPSTTPAEAVEKILPVDVEEGKEEEFSTVVHYAYGTAWGAPRGLLAVVGLRGAAATAAHFAAVWGGALFMLPRLRVTPPLKEWGAKELAIDAWHHAVYAVAAGAAFGLLDRRSSRVRAERRRGKVARARERVVELAA